MFRLAIVAAVLALSPLGLACEGDDCDASSLVQTQNQDFSKDEAEATDVESMVQLNVGSSRVSDLQVTDYTDPFLAPGGESCEATCGKDNCNFARMAAVNAADLIAVGARCNGRIFLDPFPGSEDLFTPYIVQDIGCDLNPNATSISCGEPTGSSQRQRVCACLTNPGHIDGDPHVHSLRGAHYTVMEQGVFVAWNFSKAVPGAETAARGWQLLAAYAGSRFTTQGLLLSDSSSGQSMEITPEDCAWRVKEKSQGWRRAHVELLSDGITSLEVKKLHEKVGQTKISRSAILMKMESESESKMKNIAKLVVHCRPQNHVDFKLSMFQNSDIKYVGGELGVAPDANRHQHFLFSKHSMMHMRADQEFKATGSWETLGGSPAGAAFLEKQKAGPNLLQLGDCGDAQEEAARAICSKHLQETTHPEMFSDCVFDLCRGGDESFAQSAATLLQETLEESSA